MSMLDKFNYFFVCVLVLVMNIISVLFAVFMKIVLDCVNVLYHFWDIIVIVVLIIVNVITCIIMFSMTGTVYNNKMCNIIREHGINIPYRHLSSNIYSITYFDNNLVFLLICINLITFVIYYCVIIIFLMIFRFLLLFL